MERDKIINLLFDLDSYARSVCKYEYGLPTYNNNYEGMSDHLDEMVKIIESFVEENYK